MSLVSIDVSGVDRPIYLLPLLLLLLLLTLSIDLFAPAVDRSIYFAAAAVGRSILLLLSDDTAAAAAVDQSPCYRSIRLVSINLSFAVAVVAAVGY
jgi:hypothetical protein